MTSEAAGNDGRREAYRLWSRRCGFSLYVLAALWGIVQIVFVNDGRVYLLVGLICALLATSWAVFDLKSREKAILPILQMLYFLMWPIGATIYLVSRNGWRGVLIAALHAVGLTLTVGLTFYATLYSLHYAGLLDPQFYP